MRSPVASFAIIAHHDETRRACSIFELNAKTRELRISDMVLSYAIELLEPMGNRCMISSMSSLRPSNCTWVDKNGVRCRITVKWEASPPGVLRIFWCSVINSSRNSVCLNAEKGASLKIGGRRIEIDRSCCLKQGAFNGAR